MKYFEGELCFCSVGSTVRSRVKKTGEREIAMRLCMLDYRTGQASRAIEKNCIKKLHLLIVFIPSHRQGSNIQTVLNYVYD